MAAYTFIGTTDTVTVCDCCGRANLKGTVVLQADDDFVHFGSTCGARALGMTVKEFDGGAKSADKAAKAATAKRLQAISSAVAAHPDVVAAMWTVDRLNPANAGKSFAERWAMANVAGITAQVQAEVEAAL